MREDIINFIIFALLTFPSDAFDFDAMIKMFGPLFLDPKRRVRQGVNFINVLLFRTQVFWVAFIALRLALWFLAPKFCTKNVLTVRVKRWWNWHYVSRKTHFYNSYFRAGLRCAQLLVGPSNIFQFAQQKRALFYSIHVLSCFMASFLTFYSFLTFVGPLFLMDLRHFA